MSSNGDNSTLPPELRSWLDSVIVPGLVGEYLAQLECEKSLASEGEPLVESALTRTAIAKEDE